jgi:predicted ATPase/class 3 adenylate cyclase
MIGGVVQDICSDQAYGEVGMTFEEVLDQAIAMLQRRGRVTYRMLQLQFHLDDDYLEALKEALIEAERLAVDEQGKMLVWTGGTATTPASTDTRQVADIRLYAVLPSVASLLQREGRVTYRTLSQIFGVDETCLRAVRDELVFRGVALDVQGKGLVWTGEGSPVYPSTPLAPMLPSRDTKTPTERPPVLQEAIHTDTSPAELASTSSDRRSVTPQDMPTIFPEPVHSAPAAERRQLTVMFCDLVGSTNLSGQLDPEDWREVVRAYQETAAAVIQRYDGYIAQYLGDGLLVYFGFPQAHEDDAPRAVHAGLGIIEATATLNTRLKVTYGVQLAVRLGIHTGPVVVGEMGSGGRYERLALGETPNIAARLEGLAVPDTVVVSMTTARLVQGVFALETLEPHHLKGVAEPMRVSRVLGLREVNHDAQATLTADLVALVGRDEEIGLLRRRWEQSKESVGQVVLISGEAGIGKSSLAQAVRGLVSREDAALMTLRCSPYYSNSALYPVIEHLQRVLRWHHGMSAQSKLDTLEQFLHASSFAAADTVPLLATLLSVPLPEGRYPPLTLSPHQRRQQTYDTLVAWLMAEAEGQPALMVWEDLHWADPSTLEMLGVLIEQTPTVPMLHVLTFRPEFTPPWPLRSHMTPLTLNRLERPQVEAMLVHLAHGKPLPPDVVEHIVTKTDGVPLFVEELTKMLLESTLLCDQGDHYALTGPLSAVAIPATLRDSLMARLDRLPTVRVVAQLGAVIGREFDYEMVQALAGVDETTLQEGLAQLVEAELLYQRGRPPRARYIFKHALVQDAAYASLLRSTRRQYHQRVAQLLEARFPQTVVTEPELVAHHYTEAGLVDAAIPYWQRAGEHANDRSANTEAHSHLTKGLELLGTLPESPVRRHAELVFQTILGRVLTAAKGYGDAEVAQVYTRARQLGQQMGGTPQLFPVLLGLSIYFVVRAELHTARELGEQLLRLAQRAQDPVLLVEAHYALGVTFSWLGEFVSARTHLEQGSAYYDPAQHPDHLALYGQDGGPVCLCRLAFVLWSLGYPEQALAQCHKALTMAQELSHAFSLAYVLTWVAILYNHCRTVQETQEWVDTALTFSTEQGFPFWSTQGTVLQGWVWTARGQIEDGIVQMRQGLAAMQAIGTEVLQAYCLSLLASAYGKAGQPEEGLALLEEALAKVNTSGERWPEAELHRLRGELLLQDGIPQRVQEAEASFLQALSVARAQHAKSLELRAAMSLSRLWQQQGKQTEAHELLTEVYEWFTEGFDTVDLQAAKAFQTAAYPLVS